MDTRSVWAYLATFFLIFNQSAALAIPSDGTTKAALLTEAKGLIYKRGFVDSNKEVWGTPTPATKGDQLSEGMQLGTGDKSWAQLSWKYITTRAWANSVYAIAPNQRIVYLVGGEMLFHLDKYRKDKNQYYLWTNLLQARIRGTTVMVQSTPDVSRISVLEGTIDVLNRSDHSVMRLKPGVVYEVKSKDHGASESQTQAFARTVTANPANSSNTTGASTSRAGLEQSAKSWAPAASSPAATTSTVAPPSTSSVAPTTSTSNLIGNTGGAVVGTVNGLTTGVLNTAGTLSGSLLGTADGLTNNLLSTTGGLTHSVLGTVNGLTGTATNLTGDLVGSTRGLVGGLLASTSGLTGSLTGVAGNLTNSLSATTSSLTNSLSGTTSNQTDTLSRTNNLIATASSALSTSSTNIVLPEIGTSITPMISSSDSGVPIFETEKTVTTLYSLNKNVLLNPMITGSGFETTLPSTGLINKAMSSLPSPTKLIASASEIIRVPVLLNYNIGSAVGQSLPLPPLTLDSWPPTACIGQTATQITSSVSNVSNLLSNKYLSTISQLPLNEALLGPSLPGNGGGAIINSILQSSGGSSSLTALLTGLSSPSTSLSSSLLAPTQNTPTTTPVTTPTIPVVTIPPVTIPPIPPVTIPPVTIPPIPPVTIPPIPPVAIPPLNLSKTPTPATAVNNALQTTSKLINNVTNARLTNVINLTNTNLGRR